MKDTLVVYHRADLDGLCSEAVARYALRDTADYQGWDYGEPAPDMSAYKTVYAIDISFDPEVMRANAEKLIWIDHHRSAIEKMDGVKIRGYRIDGVAACRLAWQWFYPTTGVNSPLLPNAWHFKERLVVEPYSVRLLGEYDIWDKRDPSTDLFQLGMQAEKSPDWNLLFSMPAHNPSGYVASIIERGRAIHSYTEVMNAQISQERGFDVVFEGLTFRALCTARSNSMVFEAALRPHHDGCLSYFWNGRKWRFSLYHAKGKEHHDLSKIAVKFGGGGHKGACGFELDALPSDLGGVSFLAMTTGLGQGPS